MTERVASGVNKAWPQRAGVAVAGRVPMVGPGSGGGAGGPAINSRLLQGIANASQLSALQVCLDAGVAASYPGGNLWKDISGAGNDFQIGSTSGTDTSDPTFHGSIGGGSPGEYFTFDGGDYFAIAAGANPAFIDAMHAAGATFSWLSIVYVPAGLTVVLFSTEHGGSSRGFDMDYAGSDTTLRLYELNGTGIGYGNTIGSVLINDAWCVVHVSIAEGVTNGSVVSLNGSAVSIFTASYSSPTSGPATYLARLGARGGGVDFTGNGVRQVAAAGWARALSAANHAAIYNQIKSGFGLP